MNRRLRRALERAVKKTHKLQPQTCVLWVPDLQGYLEAYNADGFRVVDQAFLAQQYCEHQACAAALTLLDRFGVRAQVRPYVESSHRRLERGSSGAHLAELLS